MSSRNRASKQTTSKKQPISAKRPAKPKSADETVVEREPFFDSHMRVDILAVIITVIALALLFSVLAPDTGVLSNYISQGLFLGLGVGAYILPIAVFIWGIGFFVHHDSKAIGRTALGFGLIIIALLAYFGLFTPGAADDPNIVFVESNLITHGGYLGGGIAYGLLRLVGLVISVIILAGIALVGVIVLGFSISRLVERAQDRHGAGGFSADRETAPERRSTSAGRTKHHNDVSQDDTEIIGNSSDKADVTVAGQTKVMERTPDKKTKKDKKKVSKPDETVKLPSTAIVEGSEPSALEGFELPDEDLLHTSSNTGKISRNEQLTLKDVARHLQQTLADFNLDAKVVGWVSGPTFTMFKVDMPAGVRLTKITGLQNDIALALAAESVRIFAPIPGTSLVGIEIPNKKRSNVLLGDVIKTMSGGPLMLGIGKDVEGDAISADLAKMPHLLIGGTTGSGKSVAINSMLISILMRATPAEVRLILIDPKRVELSIYNGIPHLFVPVVTNPKEAASVLAWATIEMDRRLKIFEKAEARDIGVYNSKVQKHQLEDDAEELPYMVIVIDELSDLMMVAGKEVEGSITRIAQLARAAGIHLIVATQRPSSNVVTGMIKANIVNRFAFKVATSLESRVILDQNGAEKLIGLGDLLFLDSGGGKPKRIQGCYVSDAEIAAVVDELKSQGEPEYHDEILQTQTSVTVSGSHSSTGGSDDDPLLWEAAEMVVESQLGSTSNIQRRLKVGYSRAGRIMDQLFERGIVGPPDGSKPREVLVGDTAELETYRAFDEHDQDEEG